MKVEDVMDILKLKHSNLAIAKNDKVLIKFIYLGLSELYRLFNLKIREETIITTVNLGYYELKNDDVSMLIEVFDTNGRPLKQTDVLDSLVWDYKIINYRSFALHHPHDGYLYAVYKACPIVLEDKEDILDIPDAMIDALLLYVGYMLHSTVTSPASSLGRSAATEGIEYYKLFKAACAELENEGYKIPLSAETLSVYARGGYV